MAGLGEAFRILLLNHIGGHVQLALTTELQLALLKSASAFDDDVTVNAAKEVLVPGVSGYSRQLVTFNQLSDGEAGAVVSQGTVTFGAATANWPAATHAWLIDTTATPVIVAHGPLVSPQTVLNTGSLVFAAGAIQLDFA